MSRTSRRDFLKVGAGAGLFGLAGCAGFPAITSVRSPNSLLRHLQIGVMNRGKSDILSIHDHPAIEMAGFCDVDLNYLNYWKDFYPAASYYQDWREMFEKELSKCDTVTISCPDHHHVQMAVEAMKAGKHVYLQKPMAKTHEEAEILRRVAAETGVVTQMGTQCTAMKCDRYTVELLRNKALGPVEKVYLFSTRKGLSRKRRLAPVLASVPDNLNWDVWLGSAAERPYAAGVYHPLLWRIWRDLGSGWIGDIGCHLIASAWQGLELGTGAAKDVWAEVITDADDSVKGMVWPTASHILWNFDGVAASDMKPFQFEWHDGCSEADCLAPVNFRPPEFIDKLWALTPLKKRPHEGKVIKCADGWILQPHACDDCWAFTKNFKKVVLPSLEDVPNHHHEFLDSVLAGRKARTDFSWSTGMRECVIAGEIAERVPGVKLNWNAKTRRFDNEAANAFLKREYRKGWEIKA